jgi:oxygen-independent coproporphyrinogen-3 oxidase
LTLAEDDVLVAQYEQTLAFLQSHGFEQYEISNFAQRGFESKHNQAYWNRKPYRGFGIGAASFDGQQRTSNEKKLMAYINRYRLGETEKATGDAAFFSENLTEEQVFLEELMLGLRQAKGIQVSLFLTRLSNEMQKVFVEKIWRLQQENLVYFDGEILKLTNRGMALENEIVIHLSKNSK